MSRLVNDLFDVINGGSPSKLDDLPSTGAGFSACLWFMRQADGTGSSDFPRLLDKRDASSTNGWSLSLGKSTASLPTALVWRDDYTTTNRQRISNNNIITNNLWYFCAVTVKVGTTATDAHIYLGQQGGQVAEVGYQTSTNGSGTYKSDASNSFGVGTVVASSGAAFFFGLLAEVRVFGNYLLSLKELQGIMNGTLSIPNPTAYWPIYGTEAPEPDLSATPSNATITQTTLDKHAPTCVPYLH